MEFLCRRSACLTAWPTACQTIRFILCRGEVVCLLRNGNSATRGPRCFASDMRIAGIRKTPGDTGEGKREVCSSGLAFAISNLGEPRSVLGSIPKGYGKSPSSQRELEMIMNNLIRAYQWNQCATKNTLQETSALPPVFLIRGVLMAEFARAGTWASVLPESPIFRKEAKRTI